MAEDSGAGRQGWTGENFGQGRDGRHRHAAPAPSLPPLSVLSPRQRAAWEFISRNGGITRTQYQDIVGNEMPVRTAQYDLHDMVRKGFIRKSGKGPATRYMLTDGAATAPTGR